MKNTDTICIPRTPTADLLADLARQDNSIDVAAAGILVSDAVDIVIAKSGKTFTGDEKSNIASILALLYSFWIGARGIEIKSPDAAASPQPAPHAMTDEVLKALQMSKEAFDTFKFQSRGWGNPAGIEIDQGKVWDAQKAVNAALLAQPAAVEPASLQNQINRLTRERDGWKEMCDDLKKALHIAECDLDVMHKHQKNDVWYWQGDGEDHPESMNNRMVVVMHAGDLNALLAENVAPSPAVAEHAQDHIKIDYDHVLLPCAHCGSEDIALCGQKSPDGYTWVQCYACGMKTQPWDRFDKSIGMWNLRTEPARKAIDAQGAEDVDLGWTEWPDGTGIGGYYFTKENAVAPVYLVHVKNSTHHAIEIWECPGIGRTYINHVSERRFKAVRDGLASPLPAATLGKAEPDYLGLALDLESASKKVESQTAQRAMEAGAQGLRLALAQQPAASDIGNWQQYAKEGENAQDVIERERKDNDALLTLLAREKQKAADSDVRDAERYRHLRECDLDSLADANWGRDGEVWTGEQFDAAVDAHMQSTPAVHEDKGGGIVSKAHCSEMIARSQKTLPGKYLGSHDLRNCKSPVSTVIDGKHFCARHAKAHEARKQRRAAIAPPAGEDAKP